MSTTLDILTPEMAAEALPVAANMVAENGWALTFDVDRALATFEQFTQLPEADAIAVRDENGEVIAGALVYAAASFTQEKIGSVYMFYVLPFARGTHVARQLMGGCLRWFREQDCRIVLASQWSKISPEVAKQFENLLRKAGMEPTGATYVMEIS